MKPGDELTLTLDDFAFEGKSVARLNGLVIFVTGAVPGDVARVRLTRIKKNFHEAEVLEIIAPSTLRIGPRCRHFGVCGGCKWQHVRYDAQLTFKRQHVIDALERIGGFRGIVVNPTLGCDDPYFYRNKMEFSFGQRWLSREELAVQKESGTKTASFALGLHVPQWFDRIVDLDECWLQSELSFRIVNGVRRFALEEGLSVYSTFAHEGFLRNLVIRQSKRTGDVMVNIVTFDSRPAIMTALTHRLVMDFPEITTVCNNITDRKSLVAIGDEERVYHGQGYITERIGERTYKISANSFFQTNTSQAERLYNTARNMAQFTPADVVFDLYSGTGTIALHIADLVRWVVCVESVSAAVEDAHRNAADNGVENCRFLLGDLRDILLTQKQVLGEFGKPNVMIIDPPRAGMHADVVRSVMEISPQRIIYISCNPTTQARDLKMLAEQYRVGDVQPVDMFPHTYHIENVVALSR
jgi:23S rRNA (uracil1939-C5)-methyltransferase